MTSPLSFKPIADHAVLVTCGTDPSDALNARVIALDAAITAAQITGHIETVPALVNLAVVFDPAITDHAQIIDAIQTLRPNEKTHQAQQNHVVDVCYDAALTPDLSAVAKATGLTEDAVIAAHLGSTLRVSMFGFAPGYAYLTGLDPRINVPRKTAPLRDVPKGSILIAGPQCLISTLIMPTGWSIIGRSPTQVMHPQAPDPFVLAVGDTVTFRRIARADLPAQMQTP